MNVEFDNTTPIYMQIVEKIKIEIISNQLKPGERLLSVRDYALKMKVNPNTMQKALAELEEKKLIFTERTNGKFVTTNQDLINQYKLEYAKNLSTSYLSNMKNINFDEEKIITYLIELIKGETL